MQESSCRNVSVNRLLCWVSYAELSGRKIGSADDSPVMESSKTRQPTNSCFRFPDSACSMCARRNQLIIDCLIIIYFPCPVLSHCLLQCHFVWSFRFLEPALVSSDDIHLFTCLCQHLSIIGNRLEFGDRGNYIIGR